MELNLLCALNVALLVLLSILQCEYREALQSELGFVLLLHLACCSSILLLLYEACPHSCWLLITATADGLPFFILSSSAGHAHPAACDCYLRVSSTGGSRVHPCVPHCYVATAQRSKEGGPDLPHCREPLGA